MACIGCGFDNCQCKKLQEQMKAMAAYQLKQQQEAERRRRQNEQDKKTKS